MNVKLVIPVILLIIAAPALAQEEKPIPQTPPSPCGQPEASQFDFWLGEWNVEAKGKMVGYNNISKLHGGCTLFEEYNATAAPFEGKSFNYYDPSDESWHQVWVDNSGTRLHLAGGFANGSMVMSGERGTTTGTVTDRISWTDNPDGTVRQLWELSTDAGVTWQVLFDGLYRHPDKDSGGSGE